MDLHRIHEEDPSFFDYTHDESPETLSKKQQIRRALEVHLERKRLREELRDELDEEDGFDWDGL